MVPSFWFMVLSAKYPEPRSQLLVAEKKGLLAATQTRELLLTVVGSNPLFGFSSMLKNKRVPLKWHSFVFCRGEGIRTLDTLLAYTHFPGVLLRPLGHPSV